MNAHCLPLAISLLYNHSNASQECMHFLLFWNALSVFFFPLSWWYWIRMDVLMRSWWSFVMANDLYPVQCSVCFDRLPCIIEQSAHLLHLFLRIKFVMIITQQLEELIEWNTLLLVVLLQQINILSVIIFLIKVKELHLQTNSNSNIY